MSAPGSDVSVTSSTSSPQPIESAPRTIGSATQATSSVS
jgi:hypothetical protein